VGANWDGVMFTNACLARLTHGTPPKRLTGIACDLTAYFVARVLHSGQILTLFLGIILQLIFVVHVGPFLLVFSSCATD